MVIGIGYDDDIKKTKAVLEEIMAQEERVLKDPEVTIAVAELADSSINFVVRPWVKNSDYWPVYFELMENIKIRLDQEKIAIPYPQMDVHIQKSSENGE